MKKRPYIVPFAESVRVAPRLNESDSGNEYNTDETGWVGFGSGEKDASLGEAKGNGLFDDDIDDDLPAYESLWGD